jgi:hypothetical protein
MHSLLWYTDSSNKGGDMSKTNRLGTYFIAGILGALIAALYTVILFSQPSWSRRGYEMYHLAIMCMNLFVSFFLGFTGGLIAGEIAAKVEAKYWNAAVVSGGILGGLLAAFLSFLVYG